MLVDVSASLRECQSTLHAAFGNQFDSLLNTAIDAGRECDNVARRHPEMFLGAALSHWYGNAGLCSITM